MIHCDDTMKNYSVCYVTNNILSYAYIYSSKHIFRIVHYFITHFK